MYNILLTSKDIQEQIEQDDKKPQDLIIVFSMNIECKKTIAGQEAVE